MLRVVCEGLKDKAEYQFVKCFCDVYYSDLDYDISDAGGNGNIVSELEDIESKVHSGDIVLLFFDNVEEIGDLTVIDIINRFKYLFEIKNVQFVYSTYYCFEEIFLSYVDYGSILKSSFYITLKTEIEKIQKCLYNRRNYYRLLFRDSVFREFWSSKINGFNNISTREQCSSAICRFLYSNTVGHFKVTKDLLGECWLSPCYSIYINANVCKNCKYSCKNCSSNDKMKRLKDKTILSFDK